MRVVLDTNIYISAILFGGNCEEIIRLAEQGAFDIVISREIISEIEDVLKDKFKWSRQQITETISFIKAIAKIIKPQMTIDAVKNDPSDNKVIECAVASHAAYIVTGDKKHLLSIRKYRGIRIIDAAEFLRL